MTQWLAAASKGCHPPTCRPITLFTVRSGGEARPAQLERIKTHLFRPGICEPRIPTAHTDLHSSAKMAFSWQGRTETTAACKRPPSLGPGSSDPTCEQEALCSRDLAPSRAPVPTFDRRAAACFSPSAKGAPQFVTFLRFSIPVHLSPFTQIVPREGRFPPEPPQRAPGRRCPLDGVGKNRAAAGQLASPGVRMLSARPHPRKRPGVNCRGGSSSKPF